MSEEKIELEDKTKKKKKDEVHDLHIWKNMPPALTKEEDLALIKEYKMYGDKKVKEKLIYGNMRLVSFFVNRNYSKFENCLSPIYPDKEDLYQEGILALENAIEKFDCEKYNFAFSTYVLKAVGRRLGRLVDISVKKQLKNVSSLNQELNVGSDEDGSEVIDFIADDSFSVDGLHEKIDADFIKDNIFPILTNREKELYEAVYVDGLSLETAGEKIGGFTRERVRQILVEVDERVKALYFNGVSEQDEETKGVKLLKGQQLIYDQKERILQAYDKEFLKEYFMPTLTPLQQKVFEACILEYCGQSVKDLAKELHIEGGEISRVLSSIDKNLEKNAKKLLKMQKNGEEPPERKLTIKQEQKINNTKKLIDDYGGRFFLYKYFYKPVLKTENEKECFKLAFLNYKGDSQEFMASKMGVTQTYFSMVYGKVKDKLTSLTKDDFDRIVSMVDNANGDFREISFSKNFNSEIDEQRRKQELVEKYGGVIKLKRLFLPTLSKQQKIYFSGLYLYPSYTSALEFANANNVKYQNAVRLEKVIESKLEEVDMDELERLSNAVESYLKDKDNAKVAQKMKDKRFDERGKFVESNGGGEFLMEEFVPTLVSKIDRDIFELHYIKGLGFKRIAIELSINDRKGTAASFVNSRIRQNIKPALNEFKKKIATEDGGYEAYVKAFYLKKEYEKAHPEDFEEKIFGDKKVSDIEDDKITEVSQAKSFFSEELINACGGEKRILRNFMPTLKSVYAQQVLLYSMQGMSAKEVARQTASKKEEVISYRQILKNKLEEFAKLEKVKGDKRKKTSKIFNTDEEHS